MMDPIVKEMTLWRQNALSVNTWKSIMDNQSVLWKNLSNDDLFYWSNMNV